MSAFESNSTFIFGGGREMVDEARAIELLSTVTVDDPTVIDLSNKSFSSEAAAVIASKLSQFQHVKIANLNDIIAGRPEEDALKTLKLICDSLIPSGPTEINLSDNALGFKAVPACSGLLSGKQIEKIYLNNDGMSAEAIEILSQIITSDGVSPPLSLLHFYNNMAGVGGGKAIGHIVQHCAQTLTDLRFSGTRSTDTGCMFVAQALVGSEENAANSVRNLTRLDLSDNSFGSSLVLPVFSKALVNQSQLTHLLLRDSGLSDSGLEVVCDSLFQSQAPLQVLDLSGNDLTPEGLSSCLPRLLSSLSASLTHLYLDDNDELGTEGADVLSECLTKLLPHSSSRSSSHEHSLALTHLSLCSCFITAAGALRLASVLSRIPSFRSLSLNGNTLSTEGLVRLRSKLEMRAILLGSMDDNDEDCEDDVEDFEEEEEDEGEEDADEELTLPNKAAGKDDVDALVTALSDTTIN